MSSSSCSCPACGELKVKNLGQLYEMPGVVHLETPGYLYKCISCSLHFRHPYVSESELEKAYRNFYSQQWADTSRRFDFDFASDIIQSAYSKGNVLDIGCFQGDFLKLLPNSFGKYGVELSKPARKIARQHGIEMVGTSINNIEVYQSSFQAITILDVMEHLPFPLKSLERIVKLLSPGGIIVLSTGNTDVLPWRLMRLEYWYYVTEHVSFYNFRWFRWVSQQLDLDLIQMKKYSHFNSSFYERWFQLAQCLTFWTWKRVDVIPSFQKLMSSIYPFNKIKKWRSAPKTQLWKDHMLLVLRSKV